MDPATLALIISGLSAATKYGFDLAKLLRDYQNGDVDDAGARARLRKAQERYKKARDAWDEAGEG